VRRRRSNGRTIAAVAALVMVVGAACSPTSTNQATSVDRAAVAKKATRQLEQAQRQDLGCDNVVMSEEKRLTTPPEHLVVLTDAYAVAEPCWDKIVFTLEPTGADMPPGYEIGYEKGPFTEGDAGQYTVETLGDAFLSLTLTPASQYDLDGKQVYKGNLRLTLKDMHHTEIVRKILENDGENKVRWLIGLDTKRPFTVDAANKPPRVTVYIAR
jgi:hypothetical protein